jgi:hypothetical protein
VKTSWTPQDWQQEDVFREFYGSDDQPNQCITWDLSWAKIRPTHYVIESRSLKSWVIEGLTDGENWEELDRQADYEGWGATAEDRARSFPIANQVECTKIRLTQTGKNHDGNDVLFIDNFDVFGAIRLGD